ncbi:hypothetical protein [Noviherbaspirillum sedimenti]|uniref:Regulatory protein, RpfE type n=1 Tax=Noviherbaspirillum sedimenti TaxID=2320865 RepID=A0A3A3G171_9BURK|nr:hypothetical protein [Noviherbaspirillum sedimenti]RJG00212.1 hypothetical protein D3878_00375 [Noviherbaspirillum sedimenti]
MSQLDILLPFGLPPPDLAKDLLRQCKTPALAMLLARAKAPQTECFDPFARALPHETWLARKLLPGNLLPESSPPLADALMRLHGLQAESGTWFVLQPVHFHIARDHLVLTDLRQLALDETESRALFDAAQPLLEESGKTLVYGDASTWFLQADDWQDLHTATPDAACGRNIDIWLPQGAQERAWRKLQNEVQMHWHMHEVNAAREARGARPVNSLWLWGGASLPQAAANGALPAPYTDVFKLSGWIEALGAAAGATNATNKRQDDCHAIDVVLAAPQRGLLLLDALLAPALATDWGSWLQELQMLEAAWFAPLLSALQGGRLQQMNLILSHNTGLAEFSVRKASLRKFWTKPGLNRLLP